MFTDIYLITQVMQPKAWFTLLQLLGLRSKSSGTSAGGDQDAQSTTIVSGNITRTLSRSRSRTLSTLSGVMNELDEDELGSVINSSRSPSTEKPGTLLFREITLQGDTEDI